MLTFPIWWTENGACACPAAVECRSPGKHPITRNGVKDASDDPDVIQEWRLRWPLANWAVATGNGLLVVDLDVKPDKNGITNFRTLGTAPRTRTVRTGSGGLHLYLKVPYKLPNTTGKLAKGVDTRCDGGYVLAPGSGHVSGGRYELVLDEPIAPAPEWLIEALSTGHRQPEAPPSRPHFPPASSSVISAARNALQKHGPAVEGNGGDLHTFRACAILVHDYALTDDEAWPLLVEWNQTCEPAWSEPDLRAKLRGGGKYGTAPYGCAREGTTIEIVRRYLTEWRDAGGHVEQIPATIQKIRQLPFRDTSEKALIEREITAATGLKTREIALPKARTPVELKKGDILVSTDINRVADDAEKAISPYVFQRNGILVEVITDTHGARISEMQRPRIRDLMSKAARWIREDEKGAVTVAAPDDIAGILHARRAHPSRELDAVTTAPVFLADGSILQDRGYNAQARVYLEPNVTVDVPDRPTVLDAQAAVAAFRDLLCDFQFLSDADFSSWLAGLLSPLVKAATDNAPAPLFCVSASSPGAGKTLLTDLIARVITGGSPEIRTYNIRDSNEWSKRLTAFVKAASPVSVFDNCNGPIGDEGLDRLITSSTWSDRLLGASEAPPLPIVSTWFATGNNIEPVGDTVRRALLVRIVVTVERPQERTGFKRPALADYAEHHRAELLTSALTILRAYHVAGRPDQKLPTWGSFVRWSDLVRGALVWAGCKDPFETQRRASLDLNEPELEAHDFWLDVVQRSDGTPNGIAGVANGSEASTVLGLRESVTGHNLRKLINRFVDKPRAGQRLRRVNGTYRVEPI